APRSPSLFLALPFPTRRRIGRYNRRHWASGLLTALRRQNRVIRAHLKLVISAVPSHDAFDAKRICDALTVFRGRVAGWKFGRAGSPLLIVDFARWKHQLEDTPSRPSGSRISEQEHDLLISELRNLFLHQLGADKFEPNEVEHSCGVWWD
ncbi:hypothetical protein, partial [Rugamonas sp.]|uniref:hypothetical protein n=1 Tax=Rugamonas sp. TaxID=1926287 RepID=UPI0025F3A818